MAASNYKTALAESAAQSIEVLFAPYVSSPRGKRKALTELDVRQVSESLHRMDRASWSRVPRLYTVLRLVNQVQVIDSFIAQGVSDLWFPFDLRTLPDALRSPSSRYEFLEAQDLVLTKAFDLEREDGKHRHFSSQDDVPLRKLEELGKGGFGHVDRVVSTITYKEYARKLLPRGRTFKKNIEVLKDFERELGHLKKLSHKHIVELVGSYTDPKFVGIIMSPVAEYNLKEFLELNSLPSGAMSFLRTFFGCLAAAVCYLHDNQIRHKDIKPQNVLVNGHKIYLTDFGISLDWSDLSQSTTTGATTKTPRYCAPEVAENMPRNSSSDLWSLGCVFLEIWTALKGGTISALSEFLGNHGSKSTCYCLNRNTSIKWCEALSAGSGPEENQPLPWIFGMLQSDKKVRWTARELMNKIREVNDDPDTRFAFSGVCCIEDDDSTKSASSSKRSSQALDETGVSSIGVYYNALLVTDHTVADERVPTKCSSVPQIDRTSAATTSHLESPEPVLKALLPVDDKDASTLVTVPVEDPQPNADDLGSSEEEDDHVITVVNNHSLDFPRSNEGASLVLSLRDGHRASSPVADPAGDETVLGLARISLGAGRKTESGSLSSPKTMVQEGGPTLSLRYSQTPPVLPLSSLAPDRPAQLETWASCLASGFDAKSCDDASSSRRTLPNTDDDTTIRPLARAITNPTFVEPHTSPGATTCPREWELASQLNKDRRNIHSEARSAPKSPKQGVIAHPVMASTGEQQASEFQIRQNRARGLESHAVHAADDNKYKTYRDVLSAFPPRDLPGHKQSLASTVTQEMKDFTRQQLQAGVIPTIEDWKLHVARTERARADDKASTRGKDTPMPYQGVQAKLNDPSSGSRAAEHMGNAEQSSAGRTARAFAEDLNLYDPVHPSAGPINLLRDPSMTEVGIPKPEFYELDMQSNLPALDASTVSNAVLQLDHWTPDVVVGVDFGMKCTAVAYSTAPVWAPPLTIQHWPGTPGNGLADMVDTVLAYNKRSGYLDSWGFSADPYNPDLCIEEYFKQFLDPHFSDDSPHAPTLQQARKWYVDYLTCIYQFINRYFEECIPRWNMKHVEFMFSVPPTWKNPNMIETTKHLIKSAGFGKNPRHRVKSSLTEAEAAIICVTKAHCEKDDVFLVCNAGEVISDVNILKVINTEMFQTEFELLSRVEGEAVGSVLIDFRVEKFVRERLETVHQYLGADPVIIAHRMMKQGTFERFKCMFGAEETTQSDLTLQIPNMPFGQDFPQAGIVDSKINITRAYFQHLFDEQIQATCRIIDNELKKLQKEHARESVTSLILLGDFSSFAYVRNKLKQRYEHGGGGHANAENIEIKTAPKPHLAVVHGLVIDRVQAMRALGKENSARVNSMGNLGSTSGSKDDGQRQRRWKWNWR